MKEVTRIETPIASIALYESPLVMQTTFFNKKVDSIKEAQEHIRLAKALVAPLTKAPLELVDIRPLKTMTKEIRHYFNNSPESTRTNARMAVLINSGISKIMGNIFLRFTKSEAPTKLFTNENKALEWLIEAS